MKIDLLNVIPLPAALSLSVPAKWQSKEAGRDTFHFKIRLSSARTGQSMETDYSGGCLAFLSPSAPHGGARHGSRAGRADPDPPRQGKQAQSRPRLGPVPQGRPSRRALRVPPPPSPRPLTCRARNCTGCFTRFSAMPPPGMKPSRTFAPITGTTRTPGRRLKSISSVRQSVPPSAAFWDPITPLAKTPSPTIDRPAPFTPPALFRSTGEGGGGQSSPVQTSPKNRK
jgi:hypothetical protein